MEQSFCSSTGQVLNHFKVEKKRGLTFERVNELRAKFGFNELPKSTGTPLWKLILEQFDDRLVQILLAAAVISFVLAWFEGEKGSGLTAFVEPLVILLILIANAVVGVAQESSAECAIKALQSYTSDYAKVLRDGELVRLNARELVPGDVVEVAVGDRIPADCRLVEIIGAGLRVDQAILTGESASVQKYADQVLPLPGNGGKSVAVVKQDQINVIFSGTTVTMGRARAIVVLTGLSTAVGEIQSHLQGESSENEKEEQKTPLKRRLDDFGDQLARIISIICVVVWVVNIRHFWDVAHGGWFRGAVYYFKIAVALAVAAIPEGLAVIITTCLALGTRKMVRKNAIVRSLPSVETLGCTSAICSDKTGTITTNEMSVNRIYLPELGEFNVSGTSYDPADGEVLAFPKHQLQPNCKEVDLFLATCALCNDAALSFADGKRYEKVGEATEAALLVLVEKILGPESENSHKKTFEERFERVATLEFDRDRKSMSVIVRDRKDPAKHFLLVKGAPETVLSRSIGGVDPQFSKLIERYGTEALRVLCLAYCPLSGPIAVDRLTNPEEFVKIEQDLIPLGLVAMQDPPRPEIAQCLQQCNAAGIRVIVITGDNQCTAEAIGKRIGLFEDEGNLKGYSFTGAEFDALSRSDQLKVLQNARLFSRVEPRHKSQLVSLLQESGHVVAMTGDGVNDAPALKRADIGIAMGSGTDVAKAAADLILTDDNFATIVAAVEEGRSIYANTKQFIRYLISSNIGEVACVLGSAILGLPEVLSPVQLLWVNLVTDGLPATALGFNPASPGSMREPPRGKHEPLVDGWLFFRYLIIGTYVGFATIAGFIWYLMGAYRGPRVSWDALAAISQSDSTTASTVALSVLVVIEMANALNSISETESLLQLGPLNNLWLLAAIALSLTLHFCILYVPYLAAIFGVAPLGWEEWILVLGLSVPVVLLDELLKLATRLRQQFIPRKLKHD